MGRQFIAAQHAGSQERTCQDGRVNTRDLDLPSNYGRLVEDLKNRVRQARLTAQRRVNTQLIELYWSIGQAVREESARHGWGSGVIRRLAEDLRAEFPAVPRV